MTETGYSVILAKSFEGENCYIMETTEEYHNFLLKFNRRTPDYKSDVCCSNEIYVDFRWFSTYEEADEVASDSEHKFALNAKILECLNRWEQAEESAQSSFKIKF